MEGQSQFSCIPCGNVFTGIECLLEHIKSSKHQKRVLEKSCPEMSAQTLGMKCDICQIFCTGPRNYEQHLNSAKHKKNAAAKKMLCGTYEESASNTTALVGNDAALSDGNGVLSNEITCSICFHKCSNFETYQDHIKTCHEKCEENKMPNKTSEFEKEKNVLALNKCSENSEASLLLCPEVFSYCEICSKRFTGPEPYQQHLNSSGHAKKKAPNASPSNFNTANLQNNITSDNVATQYSCSACCKSFSGIIPYEQHMVSPVHDKQLKKLLLIKSLAESSMITNELQVSLQKIKPVFQPNDSEVDRVSNDHDEIIQKIEKELEDYDDKAECSPPTLKVYEKGFNCIPEIKSKATSDLGDSDYVDEPDKSSFFTNSIFDNIKVYEVNDLKITIFDSDEKIAFNACTSASPDLIKDIFPPEGVNQTQGF